MLETITIIGSGNVASWFAFVLKQKGFKVLQIYGRNRATAGALARLTGAEAVYNISRLRPHSTLYLFALPDDLYPALLPQIPFRLPLAVHTAGSLSCRIFQKYALSYGVVYPCQTISKNADFGALEVPLCVEGDSEPTTSTLLQWAQQLSPTAYVQTEQERFALHLAAVFGSNFTNAMYHIAYSLLETWDINPALILPLLRQTLSKIERLSPAQAQTGPAVRGDRQTLARHVEALEDEGMKQIYRAVSQYIQERRGNPCGCPNEQTKTKETKEMNNMQNYREKLKEITTFVFDFDGVLSDGKIYVTADGEQVRATNTKDGYALQYALRKGYRVAIISGGYAESMRERYRNFTGMDIFLKVSDKVALFNHYLTKKGITPAEVLCMGDDIPDYKLMQLSGVKCCPADACEEIKAIADYISHHPGGCGAVRDAIEQTLKAQGRWFEEDACIW